MCLFFGQWPVLQYEAPSLRPVWPMQRKGFPHYSTALLDVEAEGDNVAVLGEVLFPLEAKTACRFGGG